MLSIVKFIRDTCKKSVNIIQFEIENRDLLSYFKKPAQSSFNSRTDSLG